MPRKAKELSSLEVRRLTRPGRWSVGGVDGLGLQVTQSGAQSWVLRFRIAARQREMGSAASDRQPCRCTREGAATPIDRE
jgi:hypothetical protein